MAILASLTKFSLSSFHEDQGTCGFIAQGAFITFSTFKGLLNSTFEYRSQLHSNVKVPIKKTKLAELSKKLEIPQNELNAMATVFFEAEKVDLGTKLSSDCVNRYFYTNTKLDKKNHFDGENFVGKFSRPRETDIENANWYVSTFSHKLQTRKELLEESVKSIKEKAKYAHVTRSYWAYSLFTHDLIAGGAIYLATKAFTNHSDNIYLKAFCFGLPVIGFLNGMRMAKKDNFLPLERALHKYGSAKLETQFALEKLESQK